MTFFTQDLAFYDENERHIRGVVRSLLPSDLHLANNLKSNSIQRSLNQPGLCSGIDYAVDYNERFKSIDRQLRVDPPYHHLVPVFVDTRLGNVAYGQLNGKLHFSPGNGTYSFESCLTTSFHDPCHLRGIGGRRNSNASPRNFPLFNPVSLLDKRR